MLSVRRMCSTSRKADVSDVPMIWPALSSAETGSWEQLVWKRKNRYAPLLRNHVIDKCRRKIENFVQTLATAHIAHSFPWILLTVFTAGWEHWRKNSELYRNSEVVLLWFTHAVVTNSFSRSKNLCRFPVVPITITWMMYAASVDSEAGEASHCLNLWAALLPYSLPTCGSCTETRQQSVLLLCTCLPPYPNTYISNSIYSSAKTRVLHAHACSCTCVW